MKNINVKHGFGETEVLNETNRKDNLVLLQPVRSIYQVLGTLAKFPELLLNPKMNLNEDDFIQSFHKLVFVTIKDMICKDNSIKSITHIDIDDFLSGNAELYELWEQNKGLYYMEQAIKNSNANAFKIHYREVKKYALMRQFTSAGVDVTALFKYYESDLNVFSESKQQFDDLELDAVENQLIELGKSNGELQQQLLYKQTEIDSQIDMLMKRKQELNDLGEKLV